MCWCLGEVFSVQCGYKVSRKRSIVLFWYRFSEVVVKIRGTDFSTISTESVNLGPSLGGVCGECRAIIVVSRCRTPTFLGVAPSHREALRENLPKITVQYCGGTLVSEIS
jgi:hypothetical protein